MMRPVLTACAVLVLLAGCAPGAPASKVTTRPGEDANQLASLVKGCKNVKASPVGDGEKTGLSSASACTLAGHKVFIDSFDSVDHADVAGLVKADKVEMYYATGTAWVAFIGDDPTLQLQITNDAAELLKRSFSDAQQTVDVDGSRAVAKAAARSLNGRVIHLGG